MSNDSDERTTAVAQRWAAAGWLILTSALAVDVLVRILILRQEPRQYADILLIWMATMLFASIGATASGVEPYGGKWSRSWLLILILVAVNVPVLALMGKVHSLRDIIGDVIGTAAGCFVALVILRFIYGAWERRTLGRVPREE